MAGGRSLGMCIAQERGGVDLFDAGPLATQYRTRIRNVFGLETLVLPPACLNSFEP